MCALWISSCDCTIKKMVIGKALSHGWRNSFGKRRDKTMAMQVWVQTNPASRSSRIFQLQSELHTCDYYLKLIFESWPFLMYNSARFSYLISGARDPKFGSCCLDISDFGLARSGVCNQ